MPYLSGSSFGLADVAYVPWLIRARSLMGVSLEPFPCVTAWLDRLAERPSVAAEIDVVAALA
jgi:glutathione S-transferase